MTNKISNLQKKFIDFAKGMPAIAISWEQIKRDVNLLIASLAGSYPDHPSPYLGDIRMPVYGLAYSVFIENLDLCSNGELHVKLKANIHPQGNPGEVIRTYIVETGGTPTIIALELDDTTNEIYWQEQGSSDINITPDWGPHADTFLAKTTIPYPQRDKYLDEIERQIIWLTGPSFVRLVTGVLPRYNLTNIAPWLRLRSPLKFELSSAHIVLTSSLATITVGDCTPITINIEPDPDFPYGNNIPIPTINSNDVDIAVYLPKTRLFDFFAKKLEPAILLSDSGGGIIKWRIVGSMGLKQIQIELMNAQGLTGIIEIDAKIDFVAAAHAWIDGPCGTQISVASASVLGQGDFGANVYLNIVIIEGYVEAILSVTRSDIANINWDVNPLPWPIKVIANEILVNISKDEIRKLTRTVTRLGMWRFLGLPIKYLDTLGPHESLIAHSEGLAGVSAFIGVKRKKA